METILFILFMFALGAGVFSLKKLSDKNKKNLIKEIKENG
jgi:hypothetical protein